MRIIETKVFKFDELSDEAKEKAIENLWDINLDYEWWESIYEDAENIGLKIKSFDLDRSSYCRGEFMISAPECAEKIVQEHGKDCETYKTAKSFLNDLNELTSKSENIEDVPEDLIEDLEDEFLKSLCEDYRIMLQKESEYLTTEDVIKENIQANEYEFYSNGELI